MALPAAPHSPWPMSGAGQRPEGGRRTPFLPFVSCCQITLAKLLRSTGTSHACSCRFPPRPESELSAAARGCPSSARGAIGAQRNRHPPSRGPSEMSALGSAAPHLLLVPPGLGGELFPPCCFQDSILFALSVFQRLANEIFYYLLSIKMTAVASGS